MELSPHQVGFRTQPDPHVAGKAVPEARTAVSQRGNQARNQSPCGWDTTVPTAGTALPAVWRSGPGPVPTASPRLIPRGPWNSLWLYQGVEHGRISPGVICSQQVHVHMCVEAEFNAPEFSTMKKFRHIICTCTCTQCITNQIFHCFVTHQAIGNTTEPYQSTQTSFAL